MSSRKDIIDRCRASIRQRIERPALDDLDATIYPEPLVKFIAQAEGAACKVIKADSKNDVDTIVRTVYPDAETIASNIPYVTCANRNPDTAQDAQSLNHTDVGVIHGEFGVAENGSIWIPQQMKERDVCFISENLVVILDPGRVVCNMHEAYRLITQTEYGADNFGIYGYGVFMAGPSKTADIAQVLVNGAQAARSVTVILLPGE